MTQFGVDVAKIRADDLDKKILWHIQPGTTVLELGSGGGGQSLRLVQAGATVTAVDIEPHQATFQNLIYEYGLHKQALQFIEGDINHLNMLLSADETFDYCLLQRTLHYVPYEAAQAVLQTLSTRVTSRLYISVSGLKSELGNHYPCALDAIEDRFCLLDTQKARETFSIHAPLCLYTPEEFGQLLANSGWRVEELWVSAFGNCKAVCSPTKNLTGD